MLKVYISGKISGLSRSEYLKNFKDAEDKLKSVGYSVINPAKELDELADKPKLTEKEKWSILMKESLKLMLQCEYFCMLDGWEDSEGAKIERDLAIKIGMSRVFI